jgi:peptidoglycan hydrolase CwlO-like protein
MKKIIVYILVALGFVSTGVFAYAQTATPATSAPADNSQQVQNLNDKIHQLEQKVSDLKSQGNSLASQISAMDNQITLTQYRIEEAQKEKMDITLDIASAEKRMNNLEGSLTNVTKVLINRIVATYQAGDAKEFQVLLASSNVNDLLSRSNYLKIVEAHDRQLLYDTQQARNDYSNQKTILENKKKKVDELNTQLEGYTKQLDQDKATKQQLLSSTKNDEAHYQQLLSDARAQINAMKSFTQSRAGSGGSILPPQASPDGWYFNQRDSRWGNMMMGSSSEQVWEVGCLATSMAMVMKKHGQDVTPANVVGNSSYFFSNTAYMLLPWGGGRFTSAWGQNTSAIDSKLASGEPVIAGVRGGAHFVVLKSGSGGHYTMNDPWNGPDLQFSDYYSSISQYGWYN